MWWRSASAVLRRRVLSLDALPKASECWCQLRFSRCSAAFCSHCLSLASAILRVLSLDALPEASIHAGVNCASRVAVLPGAVDVCPRRRLLSVAVCSRSMRRQASICWHQLRFSRCSAAVCSRCLSSASAAFRRRVPSLDALPGFYAGFNCASRVAVLLCVQPLSTIGIGCSRSPCALARRAARLLCWCQLRFSRCSDALCVVAVCSRRRLLSVAVCYRSKLDYRSMRCQASMLVSTALLALQCCRVQPLSTIGVGCSPSPCVPSLDAPPGFYMLASTALSRCSAAVCSRCLSSASAALRRRVLSLDAPPQASIYAGVNCAPRCSGRGLARWPRPPRLGNNFNLRLRWGTPS